MFRYSLPRSIGVLWFLTHPLCSGARFLRHVRLKLLDLLSQRVPRRNPTSRFLNGRRLLQTPTQYAPRRHKSLVPSRGQRNSCCS
ncbi:hypothetical protein B0H14DRAFT_2803026 [Mycena olivaceomarginata]|nr:hypothetical protein B0H14DRAFT_2803026 [Mycena olivaceomarginata]